ncbi:MAG: hypothetical protein AAFY70_16855 [Bacteroidota bacterium]
MRIGIFTILFFLLLGGLQAQHALFIPFGMTEAEVDSLLGEKAYIKTITKVGNLWTITLDGAWYMEYHFSKGKLYSIQDYRRYVNKKQKKKIEAVSEAVLGFMGAEDKKVELVHKDAALTSYVSIFQEINGLVEFNVDRETFRPEKETVLTLRVTSRDFSPEGMPNQISNIIVSKSTED